MYSHLLLRNHPRHAKRSAVLGKNSQWLFSEILRAVSARLTQNWRLLRRIAAITALVLVVLHVLSVPSFAGTGNTSSTASSEGLTAANASFKQSMCKVFQLIETYFGMLITIVAGIGAIIGSAFGAYRMGISLVACSCGCFIMRSLISIFFGTISC